MAEAVAQGQRGQERELKRDVLNWLNLQGCYVFSTQGMHTRTGGRCGTPEFSRVFRLRAVSSRSSSR